ncbi:kinesin-like protein KIF6 [Phlyctochytrium arcticum]|nr:kinesin-like protein KIF6 [Phlyctochytrium arcticum]
MSDVAPEKARKGGLSESIQIFARVRPQRASKQASAKNQYWLSSGGDNGHKLGFKLHKEDVGGQINNQRDTYEFMFDKVFDLQTQQEEIFDAVAKPVVRDVLDGYNGTIFAYGQTGSGKTFTITGGSERYADRGIIPRAIQAIFQEKAKRVDHTYDISISYLEIYNEIGYDLLDNSRNPKSLEDLPKVGLHEDEEGRTQLRNLSTITAADEESALNLLFIGDTNRMIAETPSNPASSRSHCLFIITLTCRHDGSDILRRSKLHLVDLAGSERVARTGIGGTLLKEAKYINLSLHYLEQVIIALHEQALGKRSHVPYRNSMMTSVLRDSLGGNCRTTMIATIAVEDQLIDESISTCRFAQRVALVANHATLNEQVDPQLVITRLKREINQLKAELAVFRNAEDGDEGQDMPSYEVERLRTLVKEYLEDNSRESCLTLDSMKKIRASFEMFKIFYQSARQSRGGESPQTTITDAPKDTSGGSQPKPNLDDIQKLERLIQHRDNEINVLLGLVNKRKQQPTNSISAETTESDLLKATSLEKIPVAAERPYASTENLPKGILQLTSDKARAFEIFKSGYPSGAWIDGQKQLLKGKYAVAKQLGEVACGLRDQIKHIKAQINSATQNSSDSESEIQPLREKMVDLTRRYKDSYQQLREFRMEIEHLQHLLEQGRLRLSRDFEFWYSSVYLGSETPQNEESSEMRRDRNEIARRAKNDYEHDNVKSAIEEQVPIASPDAHHHHRREFSTASTEYPSSHLHRTAPTAGNYAAYSVSSKSQLVTEEPNELTAYPSSRSATSRLQLEATSKPTVDLPPFERSSYSTESLSKSSKIHEDIKQFYEIRRNLIGQSQGGVL